MTNTFEIKHQVEFDRKITFSSLSSEINLIQQDQEKLNKPGWIDRWD